MLSLNDFRKIERAASKMFEDFEYELIKEIAERITAVGKANTVVYNNVEILQEMGVMYEDIIALVAKYNNQAEGEIEEIFFEAGIKTLARDDTIYRMAGLNPKGFGETSMSIINASVNRTAFNIERLTGSTAQASEQFFLSSLNKAYLEVSSGSKSYSQAIRDIVRQVPKGTVVTYSSGATMSIESAVRSNILTSLNQTCGQLQLERAREMDCDLMELTAHIDARPTHAEWQGQIVSLSGRDGYLTLDDIGYGEITGFKGINCRHDWHPYFEGMPVTWNQDELDELNNTKVTYNGKEMSMYDATQKQRAFERSIRATKKQIAGYEGALNSLKGTEDGKQLEQDLKTQRQILRNKNAGLNDFLEQTGLKKKLDRLEI